jgi:hypothetical protein
MRGSLLNEQKNRRPQLSEVPSRWEVGGGRRRMLMADIEQVCVWCDAMGRTRLDLAAHAGKVKQRRETFSDSVVQDSRTGPF